MVTRTRRAARERVLAIAKATDKNLVVLSGDSHNAWGHDLRDRSGARIGVRSVDAAGEAMFTISSERAPHYLRFVVTGPGGVDEACACTVFCAELLRRTSAQRVLLDMMTFHPEFARTDGLDVLSTLYGSMPALERIAVLIPPGKSHGLVLDVARHRNVSAREFDDLREAEAWLRGDEDASGIPH